MYGIFAAIVGVLTACQSRSNGALSKAIHNGVAAALISFGSGWIILFILCFGVKKERAGIALLVNGIKLKKLKWWELIGGMAGGFFVAVQSIAVPQIGVAIFTICIIGGQTASSLVVDRMGITPKGKQHITAPRIFAAIMTLVAVTVAVYPKLQSSTFKLTPVILAVTVGAIVSFQQGVNARVNEISRRPLATTFLNFMMGSFVLTIALLVDFANGGSIGALPSNPLDYLGGIIGVIFIAVSAFTIKHMGILNFLLFSVSGQLFGAILLDWLWPATGVTLSSYLIYGTLITLGSIGMSQYFTKRSLQTESVHI